MNNDDTRAALQRHWAASDANDFVTEHEIYRADAVLEYPQSGERIRGRSNIQASRAAQPNTKRFTVRRIIGGGDLWISELVLTYDEQPFYVVSVMEFEFESGEVIRETQYFGEPFAPGPSRTHGLSGWSEHAEPHRPSSRVSMRINDVNYDALSNDHRMTVGQSNPELGARLSSDQSEQIDEAPVGIAEQQRPIPPWHRRRLGDHIAQ